MRKIVLSGATQLYRPGECPPGERLRSWPDMASALQEVFRDLALDDEAVAGGLLEGLNECPPLSELQYVVLSCGVIQDVRSGGEGFDYRSIVRLSYDFQGNSIPTATIYKVVQSLENRNLVREVGKERSEQGRASLHYVVTNKGKSACRLAYANMQLLRDSKVA
jgi:hypothetical protein